MDEKERKRRRADVEQKIRKLRAADERVQKSMIEFNNNRVALIVVADDLEAAIREEQAE